MSPTLLLLVLALAGGEDVGAGGRRAAPIDPTADMGNHIGGGSHPYENDR